MPSRSRLVLMKEMEIKVVVPLDKPKGLPVLRGLKKDERSLANNFEFS